MIIILALYIFIIGVAIGSFANMLAYRVHFRKPLNGRSFCDFNGQPLTVRDLIPVVSYIVYRGRCRVCHEKLPVIYPLLELTYGFTTLLVAYLCWRNGLPVLEATYYVLAFWMLLFFGSYDLLYWKLPRNVLLLSVIVLVAISNLQLVLLPGMQFVIISRLAAALILVSFTWIIRKLAGGAGMHENDLLLVVILGLVSGLERLLLTVLIALLSASVAGIIVAYRKGKLKGVLIQLAPFVYFGALSAFAYYFIG